MKNLRIISLTVIILIISVNLSSAEISDQQTVDADEWEYTQNILMTDNEEKIVNYNSWGEHDATVGIGSALLIYDSYMGSVYNNQTLVYIDPSDSKTVIESSIVAIIESTDEKAYIGNVLQEFSMFENDKGDWKPHHNWFDPDLASNSRYHDTDYTADGSHMLNYILINMNQSNEGNYRSIPRSHEYYIYKSEEMLRSGFFSPNKVINNHNQNRNLDTRFYMSWNAFDQTKEYVMQINSQIFGSSKNGDPNANLIHSNQVQLYIRFEDFDDSTAGDLAMDPNQIQDYQRTNYDTYFGFIIASILYIGAFIYMGKRKKKPSSRNSILVNGEAYELDKKGAKIKKFSLSVKEEVFFIAVAIFLIRSVYLIL